MADRKESDFDVANDFKSLRALNSSGDSVKIEKSVLLALIGSGLKIQTAESDGGGANFLRVGLRPSFVVAYDERDFTNYIVYLYWTNPQQTVGNVVVLSNYKLSIGAKNAFGTVTITGVPVESVRQFAIGF